MPSASGHALLTANKSPTLTSSSCFSQPPQPSCSITIERTHPTFAVSTLSLPYVGVGQSAPYSTHVTSQDVNYTTSSNPLVVMATGCRRVSPMTTLSGVVVTMPPLSAGGSSTSLPMTPTGVHRGSGPTHLSGRRPIPYVTSSPQQQYMMAKRAPYYGYQQQQQLQLTQLHAQRAPYGVSQASPSHCNKVHYSTIS